MNQGICSNCGANYEYYSGRWKCPACGLYKSEEFSNEEMTLLYNAAQRLRLAEFGEAEREYSDIIEKYPQNHSGYWGRLLSRYGIKYEETYDGRKLPTCYATSIESVISSRDYKKALELADKETREYYKSQAEYIERVRKEWVEKASKEEPYDVFICYKDGDHQNGIERTKDSIEAQELYIHLMNKGYRVFFSRESLRNKIGEKYEPYIFNALSTAKVMIVYGSKSEYITSTWLKNEWTRYAKLMELGLKDHNSLIVAYEGFSPSELPPMLSYMQCINASRKTFFLDIDEKLNSLLREGGTVTKQKRQKQSKSSKQSKSENKTSPQQEEKEQHLPQEIVVQIDPPERQEFANEVSCFIRSIKKSEKLSDDDIKTFRKLKRKIKALDYSLDDYITDFTLTWEELCQGITAVINRNRFFKNQSLYEIIDIVSGIALVIVAYGCFILNGESNYNGTPNIAYPICGIVASVVQWLINSFYLRLCLLNGENLKYGISLILYYIPYVLAFMNAIALIGHLVF